MNRIEKLKAARRALIGSKKYLWNGLGHCGLNYTRCICHAIEHWEVTSKDSKAANIAKDLVMRTLDGHMTYFSWLFERTSPFEFISDEAIQDGRRRMTNMLIKHINQELEK